MCAFGAVWTYDAFDMNEGLASFTMSASSSACQANEWKHGQRHSATEIHTVVEGGIASVLFTLSGNTPLCRAVQSPMTDLLLHNFHSSAWLKIQNKGWAESKGQRWKAWMTEIQRNVFILSRHFKTFDSILPPDTLAGDFFAAKFEQIIKWSKW